MRASFNSVCLEQQIPADTLLLPRADLAFIFGNKYITAELAAKTAQLYHAGRVDRIVATGGVATVTGETESEALLRELTARAVPDHSIIVETHSTNTEENIIFGKRFVDEEIGLENIGTVIGVGHAAAGPRFLMSLSKHWPSALPMHVSVFPKGLTPKNWHENPEFVERISKESAKLPFYLASQYIAPVYPADIDRILNSRPDLSEARPGLMAS